MSDTGVRIQGLTRAFDAATVLSGLDIEIAAGEFVALLGRSGSGKTTLLRILAGLDTADSGTVEVPSKSAVVFQEPRLIPWKSVAANVVLGLKDAGAEGRALAALFEVGLATHAAAWPSTLSGGEAQRVALARALVREPELLLLDEPFAALDALTRLRMHGLVAELWQRYRPSVLLVTHDVDEALLLADRVVVLAQGRIAVEHRVDLKRLRDPTHPRFAELKRSLLQALGVDLTFGAQHRDDTTTLQLSRYT